MPFVPAQNTIGGRAEFQSFNCTALLEFSREQGGVILYYTNCRRFLFPMPNFVISEQLTYYSWANQCKESGCRNGTPCAEWQEFWRQGQPLREWATQGCRVDIKPERRTLNSHQEFTSNNTIRFPVFWESKSKPLGGRVASNEALRRVP